MNVEFRHGPKDGMRKFLPVGKLSDTILIEIAGKDYLYKKTSRTTRDGFVVYQCLGTLAELSAA